MRRSRKAQSGAAVLVVLIALLIILYVLFLPPAQRAILLGEHPPGAGPADPTDPRANVLFSTVPRVAEERSPEEHRFAPFSVRTFTEGNLLAQRDRVSVSRTVFHNNPETMRFTLPDRAGSPLLSFGVEDSVGGMIIFLNGEQIASTPLSQRQPSPIALPQGLLRQDNTLTFMSDPVGFNLWRRHQAVLRAVTVTADVTDVGQSQMEQRFVLRDLRTLEEAVLVFVPECMTEPSRLEVRLNNQPIYSGVPPCGLALPVQIAPARLNDGENLLSWRIDAGHFIIDQAAVHVRRAQQTVQESFSISDELFRRAPAEGKAVRLRLTFREPGAEGVIVLNDQRLSFRTYQRSFSDSVMNFVRAGQNTIWVAETSRDIVALEVIYE
jgi:hypothetical protein